MLQKCRKMLRNEKGLTLIELLAVVVILGIIAAIAIPSIGSIIDNSKRDAHVANAEQLVNSTKLALASDAQLTSGNLNISLQYLIDNGFIETIENPDGGTYSPGAAIVAGTNSGLDDTTGSYVVVANGTVTSVKLIPTTGRGIQDSSGNPIAVGSLSRETVE